MMLLAQRMQVSEPSETALERIQMEERNDMVDLRLLCPARAAGNGAHRPLLDQCLPKISGDLVGGRLSVDGCAGSGIGEDPLDVLRTAGDVAGYLGGRRRAVGEGTGQGGASGGREEGNGHHGGGLMRQPLAAGGHAQLDEIFNGSGGVLVVGAECGSGGPALRGIAVSRLRAVSGSRSDV